MKLTKILTKLDSMKCRVGPSGLYLADEFFVMLITDWKTSKLWSSIGREVIRRQDSLTGLELAPLMSGEISKVEFSGTDTMDDMLHKSYRKGRKDLMEQYQTERVCIKIASEGDFIVFNDGGEELFILDNHVFLLAALGAKLMASDENEDVVSFSADPGIIGYLHRIDLDSAAEDPADEDIEECRKILGEFEHYYGTQRRDPLFHKNYNQSMAKVRAELVDTLSRIGGYERHMDTAFNSQVESLIEEVFPQVTVARGLSFPVRGSGDFFETAHPERFQFLETDGKKWYVFVADWDKGYTDGLGTYIPIEPNIADYLQKKMPALKVRRADAKIIRSS